MGEPYWLGSVANIGKATESTNSNSPGSLFGLWLACDSGILNCCTTI
jgi:hypothetical protein